MKKKITRLLALPIHADTGKPVDFVLGEKRRSLWFHRSTDKKNLKKIYRKDMGYKVVEAELVIKYET